MYVERENPPFMGEGGREDMLADDFQREHSHERLTSSSHSRGVLVFRRVVFPSVCLRTRTHISAGVC